MNITKIACFLIAIAVSIVSAKAGTASIGGNIGIGAANDNVDVGLALQGFLELDATSNIAARGTALFYGGDTKVDLLSDGSFTMLGFEGSLVFKFPAKGITPYFGGGPGIYLPNSELSDNTKAALAYMGVRGEDDLQPGFGLHAMGGFAIDLAPNVSLDLNIKYVYLKTDNEAKVTNLYTYRSVVTTGEVDLSTLFATAGLIIKF